jgi:hypothetical protein
MPLISVSVHLMHSPTNLPQQVAARHRPVPPRLRFQRETLLAADLESHPPTHNFVVAAIF